MHVPNILPGVLLLILAIGCGSSSEGVESTTAETIVLPEGVPAMAEYVRANLLAPLESALAHRRQGAMQDLFANDTTHAFPVPGAGQLVEPLGLALHLLEESDTSELTREDLARNWLAHFAGWATPVKGEWQLLNLQTERTSEAWTAEWRVTFSGRHTSGVLQNLQLHMQWRMAVTPGAGLQIVALKVLDGLRGHAVAERYQSVGHWVGMDTTLSKVNRQGLSRPGDQGLLHAVGLTSLDWNGDAFPDVLLSRHGAHSELFLNDGQSGFLPGLLPLQIPRESPGFLLAIDLDGDGLQELIGTRFLKYKGEFGYPGLYTRSRSGFWSLEEEALALPIGKGNRSAVIHSVSPIDFDRDGRMDLVFSMGAEGQRWDEDSGRPVFQGPAAEHRNYLLRNAGDFHFEEVGEAMGLTSIASTKHMSPVDWNGDGLIDLYEATPAPFEDHLWLAGPGGRFGEPLGWSGNEPFPYGDHQAALALPTPGEIGQSLLLLGRYSPAVPMGLASTGSNGETESNGRSPVHTESLARAAGNHWLQPKTTGQVDDLAAQLGIARGNQSQCIIPLDVGNRGAFDLLVCSRGFETTSARLYIDTGRASGELDDVASLLGLGNLPPVGAAIPCDVDGDGDLDLIFAGNDGSLSLLADTGAHDHFARITLQPKAGSALGSVVEVTTPETTQSGIYQPMLGPKSQKSEPLHFGLGSQDRISSIAVRWSSGQFMRFENVPADKSIVLKEADGTWTESEIAIWKDPIPQNRKVPQIGGYSRLLDGKNHPLGRLGVVNLVHFVERVNPEQPWPWPQLGFLDADSELSLVVMDSDGWNPSDDAPFLAYVCDQTMLREFLGDAVNPKLPSTFLFDHDGRMVRAFSGEANEEALRGVLRLAANDRGFPELLVRLGFESLGLREYNQALNAFAQAIDSDPTRIDAYLGLCHTQRYLGNLDAALLAISSAARVDPDFAIAHQLLGTLELSQGKGERAMRSFQRVIDLEGDSARAWFSLCEAAIQAKQWDAGLEAVDQTLLLLESDANTLAMQADAHCARGKLLEHLKRGREAQVAYKEALALDPTHPEALDCNNRLFGRLRAR